MVTVASGLYRLGRLDLADLAAEHRYSPGGAYATSKLANILFGLELDRRLRAAGSPVRSLLAHPGMAKTDLDRSAPLSARVVGTVLGLIMRRPIDDAVTPILYAATDPAAPTGRHIGPGRPLRRTRPTFDTFSGAATDPDLATRQWPRSAELTGIDITPALPRHRRRSGAMASLDAAATPVHDDSRITPAKARSHRRGRRHHAPSGRAHALAHLRPRRHRPDGGGGLAVSHAGPRADREPDRTSGDMTLAADGPGFCHGGGNRAGTAPAPRLSDQDHRSKLYRLEVGRAAADQIAACETHLQRLAALARTTSPRVGSTCSATATGSLAALKWSGCLLRTATATPCRRDRKGNSEWKLRSRPPSGRRRGTPMTMKVIRGRTFSFRGSASLSLPAPQRARRCPGWLSNQTSTVGNRHC
ncbi:hypothetical protein ACQEVZ_39570 [Dactylosporangium sp. CA-152071]|uniref:hypothetical protein n=1 Tax=Dactylosporangium sp. CA-152071 TaxID=3239933 RepID=UPI003D8A3AC3